MLTYFFWVVFIFFGRCYAIQSRNNECTRPTQTFVTHAYSISNDKVNVPVYAQHLHLCQFETNTTTFVFNSDDVIDTSGKWILYFGNAPNIDVKIDNTFYKEFTQNYDKFYFTQVDYYPKSITFTKRVANSERVFIISPVLFKYHAQIPKVSDSSLIASLVLIGFFTFFSGWSAYFYFFR